jgi:translation initiation factor IF-3
MARAREAGLDLVEVDANGNPPVCRILDYGKWKYEQAKKERDARKHQRGTMVHEVRLRPRTGQHDIDLKVRIVERLLAEGDKVKLSVMFRGREMSHPEVGHDVLNRALSKLGEQGLVEKPAGMEGRFLSVILTPTVKKPKPGEEGAPAAGNGSDGSRRPRGGNGGVAQAREDAPVNKEAQEAAPSIEEAPKESAETDGTDATEEAGT